MKKKEEIFKEIINYYENNLSMPTIRYLMNKFEYHSTNIVYKYLKKLEEEQYLVRNINNQLVLNKKYTTNIKEIPIINSQDKIKIFLEKDRDYLGYLVKDNHLIKNNIIKKDILIIEKGSKPPINGMALFNINNTYIIGNYELKDNFFIIDYENTVICDISSYIGKVILLERNIKRTIS